MVKLVAYRLGGRVEQWYQNFLIGRCLNLPPLTWKEFFEAFMIRFLSASRRAGLVVEFERLIQASGMTVSEYEDKKIYLGISQPNVYHIVIPCWKDYIR